MKKVLYFASSHKIGLTGLLTEKLCHLAEQHVDLVVVSGENQQYPGLSHKLRDHGINHAVVVGLDDHKGFFRLAREFACLVDQFNPHIVHVQTNWQLAIASCAKLFCSRRYVLIYTIHGYRHNYRARSVLARCCIGLALAALSDRIIATSSYVRSVFSYLSWKTEVLPLGVDDAFFSQPPPELVTTPKRIIFAGQFRTGKNQEVLIRAFDQYMRSTNDCEVELYLPGEGKNLTQCQQLCSRLGIADKVFFPGFVDRSEMLRLYSMCQFAIIPSNVETFGSCIVEPYVLHLVVISRPTGIACDLIKHRYNGFIFNTEEELICLLMEVLQDNALCANIRRRAQENREMFHWNTICQQYVRILESIKS